MKKGHFAVPFFIFLYMSHMNCDFIFRLCDIVSRNSPPPHDLFFDIPPVKENTFPFTAG